MGSASQAPDIWAQRRSIRGATVLLDEMIYSKGPVIVWRSHLASEV